MRFPYKDQVQRLRDIYPKGTRVELVAMEDPFSSLKPGDRGSVDHFDSIGTAQIIWDNGSTLGAVYGSGDELRILTKSEVIKEQCRKVAVTGRTNMFDTKAAFEIAVEMGFNELADFIFMDTNAYCHLILTGEIQ